MCINIKYIDFFLKKIKFFIVSTIMRYLMQIPCNELLLDVQSHSANER